ncbi:cell division control protein 45 homolog isoform X1 [Diachasmimorpha longicaudata]|uniref:cell division control protein 45 homolog isoform X1 n=2 Tax=Diachasmimorpha longicaudata TaxID=58733 RepID=UPI0030B87B2A
MFVENLKDDFYDVIQGNRCLLLVNFDIDAICACKILQHLFKNDNMLYTVVPVQGISDVYRSYRENCDDVKYVVMINCGGIIDIVGHLEPPEHITFFVVDSHRPFDLCNIYSESQIRILHVPLDEDDIPEYEEVFRDDSSDEEEQEEDSDEEESRQSKRRRLNEEDMLRKRQRREWEEKRDTILFNYSQYSHYGKSSAVLMFEMAWRMSKDSLDMVWWAIVGSTERAILNKVESQVSVLEAGNLQGQVSRLSHRQGVDAEKQQQSALKIIYDKDLQLALYRHWTVESSLRHSMTTAVSLRLWSIRGEQRLKELLAEMGLPLAQSKQKFSSMDLNLRQEFRQMVENLATKYHVEDVLGASFTLQFGYKFKYCASDIVYAMLALLESSSKDSSPHHCFLDAMDCLSRMKKETLEKGIDKAKVMLASIFKTAQGILEMKKVMNAGSFLYVIIPEGVVDSRLFSHPHTLLMLAQFVLKAYVASTKRKGAAAAPLVASANYDFEEETCLLVGIPPVCEDQPRSLFGKAFEQAAKNINAVMDADYFDTTIIRLKTQDRSNFFDALATLLT